MEPFGALREAWRRAALVALGFLYAGLGAARLAGLVAAALLLTRARQDAARGNEGATVSWAQD